MKDTMIDLTWKEIEESVNNNGIVLLPLGVIEAHGPHLCSGTDILTATVLAKEVQKKLESKGNDVMIAPPFYWGVCQSTRGFLGSFNIRKETAEMLLYDVISSLIDFGFKKIYGINAHGDIEHSIVIIEVFKKINETFDVTAKYGFDEWRLPHFGLTGQEPFILAIEASKQSFSSSKAPDVHGGDIETAMMHHFYANKTNTLIAKDLPPVYLNDEDGDKWLFGGHIHDIAKECYIGSPSDFVSVQVKKYIEVYVERFIKDIC